MVFVSVRPVKYIYLQHMYTYRESYIHSLCDDVKTNSPNAGQREGKSTRAKKNEMKNATTTKNTWCARTNAPLLQNWNFFQHISNHVECMDVELWMRMAEAWESNSFYIFWKLICFATPHHTYTIIFVVVRQSMKHTIWCVFLFGTKSSNSFKISMRMRGNRGVICRHTRRSAWRQKNGLVVANRKRS